ncbi:MAG TPA: TetR/AcrR family transcriptional regulator [Stackebrandtia sp.]|jgi:AcrR family transcriptional regulator|uniref:TetR/AcrR family transcriptional regulator n=1 Tax=Stackebrandtia sp. TaxID=2023065 RepID=UPI002D336E6B|nr:TetR/AcrR family transcriptional regulator [Stackebrandtia sp.]HZE40243.1 TetR/AcrR family transcriptional regulator [Stackebrandtia sp.]
MIEKPTRRRGAALEQAILAAAATELEAGGYAAFTMERVAKRAGTNKNAVYRRWPNRVALGLAAYREMIAAETCVPDTGELRADVLEMLRGANRHLASPYGEIVRGLLADAAARPELMEQLRERMAAGGGEDWLTVLGRAVARGEAPPESLHPRVATVPIALLRNEFVVRGSTTVPDSTLVEIVDEVFLPLIRGRTRP